MNEIEKRKPDELPVPVKQLPVDLTQPSLSAITVVTIIFFVMMAIPAHIAVAMLFATVAAVCWQLRLMLNGSNKRIEQLEALLSISTQDKGKIENEPKKLIE